MTRQDRSPFLGECHKGVCDVCNPKAKAVTAPIPNFAFVLQSLLFEGYNL